MAKMNDQEMAELLKLVDEKSLHFHGCKFLKKDGSINKIGEGTFGFVYETESEYGEVYAVKILGCDNPGFTEWDSIYESKNKVMLQHELGRSCNNILKIDEVVVIGAYYDESEKLLDVKDGGELPKDLEDGWRLFLFIKMEKLDAIYRVTKRGAKKISFLQSYNEKEILCLAKDIANALQAGHSYKDAIVHRDVKPENILWDESSMKYKLADFGLARTVEDGVASSYAGTPAYAAPEIERDKEKLYNGIKADIYSWGATVYMIMNNWNKTPLYPRYKTEVLQDPINGSQGLKDIVLKACSYEPEDRYDSMKEIIVALEKLETSLFTENDTEEVENAITLIDVAEVISKDDELTLLPNALEEKIENDESNELKESEEDDGIKSYKLRHTISGATFVGSIFVALFLLVSVFAKNIDVSFNYLDLKTYAAMFFVLITSIGMNKEYARISDDLYARIPVLSLLNYIFVSRSSVVHKIVYVCALVFYVFCIATIEVKWPYVIILLVSLFCSARLQGLLLGAMLLNIAISVFDIQLFVIPEYLYGTLVILAGIGCCLTCMRPCYLYSSKKKDLVNICHMVTFEACIVPLIAIAVGVIIGILKLFNVSISEMLLQMHLITNGLVVGIIYMAWLYRAVIKEGGNSD